jgi:hypothetical protein
MFELAAVPQAGLGARDFRSGWNSSLARLERRAASGLGELRRAVKNSFE